MNKKLATDKQQQAYNLLRQCKPNVASIELETILLSMNFAERKAFAQFIYTEDIHAPMIVFFDYDRQEWLI